MAAAVLSPGLAASGLALFGNNELPAHSGQETILGAPAARLLASSAARRGQLTKAGRLLWNQLAANPNDREMRLTLVAVLLMRDQPREALELLDELLRDQPDDVQAIERKGFILIQLGRLDEALEIYSSLVAAYPSSPPLLLARGNVSLALGQKELAVDEYRRALDFDPNYGEAWWALANIKTVSFSADDIRQMSWTLSRGDLRKASRINLEFALGKSFEDAGNPEKSFEHYRRGNELQSVGAFNATEAAQNHVDEVVSCFDGSDFGRSGHESSAPLFIVGMPRSGTTLVEQILASHPDVEGTAELPTMSAIARSLGEGIGRSEFDYSCLLAEYSDGALRALGENYLRKSGAYRRTDRPFFIDKMPSNWMHVALIKSILPNARIIDMRRDALDCCFSNYAQLFPGGHEFTHRLDDLGIHYRNYERLMAHFDKIAPGAVIQVKYEQLVDQPEQTIGNLLERLNLPFAQSCLRFFENDRAVRTPSAQQVRQPINRKGVGRAQPFLPWLGELQRALS